MDVYFSGRYSRAKMCQAAKIFLEGAGHVVVSRWHKHVDEGGHGPWDGSRSQAERFAQENLNDLRTASVVIAWQHDDSKTPPAEVQHGGRHVELGVAWGLGKTIIIISGTLAPENIYQALPNIKCVSDLQEAIEFIDALAAELGEKRVTDEIEVLK